MSITAKTRLGPYEIQSLLGSGGMGEVYLARDTRLGRTVAIKVISESLSRDEDARERFQREARAASALNHPNICTIYDVGEWEYRPFLAMEYIDGQSLSIRLRTAPLRVSELLDLFIKLASGVEAAHSRGIIHRDIKPANIVVTAENEPKIMDFGLAKLLAPKTHRAMAGLETVTSTWIERSAMLTMPGTAVGTAAYMSPEQARGEELDARTDLFSLGLILYEAATGKRAFEGATAAVIFTELLTEDPDPPAEVNASLPPELDEIIRKAIQKDRELRYQDASDLLADLRRFQREFELGQFAARAKSRVKLGVGIVAALFALAFAAVGALWFLSRPGEDLRPEPITANSFENTIVQSVLSPDGRMIAYGDRLGIHLRLTGSRDTRTIQRPAGFSHDDSWWPADWFPDGNRLLVVSATASSDGLSYAAWVVSTLSGAALRIREDSMPYAVSRDGSLIAFTAGGLSLGHEIWVMTADGQNARRLLAAADQRGEMSALHWSPDGRRIAYREAQLETDHVAIRTIGLDGAGPTPIEPNAMRWGDFCWLADGRLIFSAAAGNAPGRDMNLFDLRVGADGRPMGHPRRLSDWTGFEIENLSASRDGTQLAFNKVNKQTDVYVGQLRGKALLEFPRRFTLDDYNDYPFFWSPDSKSIVFSSNELGTYEILRQNLNEDQPQVILAGSAMMDPVRLTPDGSSLLFLEHSDNASRLMMASSSGGFAEPFGYEGRVLNVSCALSPAANCLIGTRDPDGSFVFSELDLAKRQVHRLFSMNIPGQGPSWTLSPKGDQVALVHDRPTGSDIDVYDLAGNLAKEVKVRGINQFSSIDWASDARSWFVSAATVSGCAMLRISPDGGSQVVWNMRGHGMRTWAVPSPNGRMLAFLGWTIDRNVWLVNHLPKRAMGLWWER